MCIRNVFYSSVGSLLIVKSLVKISYARSLTFKYGETTSVQMIIWYYIKFTGINFTSRSKFNNGGKQHNWKLPSSMKKSYNNRCSSLSPLISPPLCYKTWYHPEVIRSFIIWHRNLEILTSQAPMFSMIAPLLILLRIPAITWLPENRAVQKQYYIFFCTKNNSSCCTTI